VHENRDAGVGWEHGNIHRFLRGSPCKGKDFRSSAQFLLRLGGSMGISTGFFAGRHEKVRTFVLLHNVYCGFIRHCLLNHLDTGMVLG